MTTQPGCSTAPKADTGDPDSGAPDTRDEQVSVNLAAAMRVTRSAPPALLAAAPSSLVLIGAGAARTAFADKPAYVVSKHGLAGFARSVFLDVRDRTSPSRCCRQPAHVCPVEVELRPQRTP